MSLISSAYKGQRLVVHSLLRFTSSELWPSLSFARHRTIIWENRGCRCTSKMAPNWSKLAGNAAQHISARNLLLASSLTLAAAGTFKAITWRGVSSSRYVKPMNCQFIINTKHRCVAVRDDVTVCVDNFDESLILVNDNKPLPN